MPVLDAKNLRKSFGSRVLLDGVDVTIRRRERVGIVGDNGAGKSTLAKILGGVLEADEGTVHRRKGARIEYLPQEPHLPAGQSALAIARAGLSTWLEAKDAYDALSEALGRPGADTTRLLEEQAHWAERIEELGGFQKETEAERLLNLLGITEVERDVATMSGGERRRVALARLLLAAPDLAILDEPTNHLDATTIEWLEEYLAERFPGALLLVTHDRFLLNDVVTRTWEVEAGQVHSYEGGWEEFLLAREERRAQEERTEQNRQNFLRKEIEWLRRQPKARTGKQKARIQRAETALRVEGAPRTEDLQLGLVEARLGGTILEARGLGVEIGGRRLVDALTLHVTKGSRIGILGKSGAGKTTLLRTLLGEIPPASGEVVRGKNTRVAYLDQLRSGLDESLSVFDAVTGGHPSVRVGEESWSSYSYLERFRFRGDALRQKIGGLSGGERARVALARLLLEPANVLVLDEPTNDLDVMTLGALEDLLESLSGAALLVSHDRYFLDRIATSVLALDGQGGIEEIAGGYSAFAARRKELESRALSTPPAAPGAQASDPASRSGNPRGPGNPKGPASPKKKSLTYAEEKEFAGLLTAIEEATSLVRSQEAALAEPSLYTERRDQVEKLQTELAVAKSRLEELEERWFFLEEKRAGSG